jgi:short-subunit dehydrogenase
MSEPLRPLAVVTGASSGAGYELARIAAEKGYDLVAAADSTELVEAAQSFHQGGVRVDQLQADLATRDGVNRLVQLIAGRPVDVLMVNAGEGLGHPFLDQAPEAWMHVINTNIVGALYLVQQVGPRMRERGQGRILFAGPLVGLTPGTFNAVYDGAKAFIEAFALTLRNELEDTGVTVTCFMPGPAEIEFFERAGLKDAKAGLPRKDDPARVARLGWEAMMQGEGDALAGLRRKPPSAAPEVSA